MKKLILIIGLILAISIPITAYATTSDDATAQAIRSFCGFDISDLTDEQKADLENQQNAMIDLRKESIKTMVENGTLTTEESDEILQNINDMIKYREENDFTNGFRGFGHGKFNSCTFNEPLDQ